MDLSAIGRQALVAWLLFPAIGLPAALIAHRLGHAGFVDRLLVWFAIVPAVLVPSYLGPGAFLALLIAGCSVACYEVTCLAGVSAALGLAVALASALPWIVWTALDAQVPAGGMVSVLAIGAVTVAVSSARARHARVAALGLIVGAGLSFWMRLQQQPDGFRFVLFAFSIVAMNDVMAFLCGRLLAGVRPFPRVSPNKTVTGYAGGLIVSVLVAYIARFAVPEFDLARLTVAGALLGASGSLGDLAASAVKRQHGVKDFGRLLGPIGGVLDRLDSMIGAGWVFYLYLQM